MSWYFGEKDSGKETFEWHVYRLLFHNQNNKYLKQIIPFTQCNNNTPLEILAYQSETKNLSDKLH